MSDSDSDHAAEEPVPHLDDIPGVEGPGIDPCVSEMLSSYTACRGQATRRVAKSGNEAGVPLQDMLDPFSPALCGNIFMQKLYNMAPVGLRDGIRQVMCGQEEKSPALLAQQRVAALPQTKPGDELGEDKVEGQSMKLREKHPTFVAPIHRETEVEINTAKERKGVPKPEMNTSMRKVVERLCNQGFLRKVSLEEYNRIVVDTPGLAEKIKTHGIPYASMFLVDKAGKTGERKSKNGDWVVVTLKRIIFDARCGNAYARNPTEYSLFSMETLQQTFSNFLSDAEQNGSKRVFAASIDWKQFFYQLPCPPWLAVLFPMLHSEGVLVLPNAMPMGYSRSPYIGQSVTWSLVLGHPNGEQSPIFRNDLSAEHLSGPPPWMPLFGKGNQAVGAVFVLLDNVFIIGTDREVVTECLQRVRQNRDHCNVWEKTNDAKVIDLEVGKSSPSVECFGIEFSGQGFRAALKTFADFDPEPEQQPTSRGGAERLGLLNWDFRVRGEAYLNHHLFMEVYRRILPESNDMWDEKIRTPLSPAEMAELRSLGQRAKSGTWVRFAPWRPKKLTLFASDAAGSRRDGSCVCAMLYPFKPQQKREVLGYLIPAQHEEIALRELHGFVYAVQKLRAAGNSWQGITLVVGAIDNRVAQSWIVRQYSHSEAARELLKQLRDCLGARRCAVVRVASKDNFADIPTRKEVETEQQWDQTEWLLKRETACDETYRYDATQNILQLAAKHAVLAAQVEGRQYFDVSKQQQVAGESPSRRGREGEGVPQAINEDASGKLNVFVSM